MEFFKKISDFIQDLEEKDFYKYIVILLACLLMIISFMIYRYYSKINEYSQEIERINELRNDKVKNILTRLKVVQTQKKGADDMLKKDADFKIKDYFDRLLSKLNLTEYRKEDGTITEKEVNDYREIEFPVELNGMDMAQLCELLKELEATPRIKINLLEIKKSQKKNDAIDVNLTISTLLLKTETTT